MNGKQLGKITFAEFGTIKDYPFCMGLQLQFKMGGGGVGDGGKYTVNMTQNENCKYTREEQKEYIVENVEHLYALLKSAKCNYVSELVGKPVEIEIESNHFKGFRILTEVL